MLLPDASSPAVFVNHEGHDLQTWNETYSSTSHVVASHVVSEPDASSPSAFVVPGGHDLQTWEETYSFAEHIVTSHSVFGPDALSICGVRSTRRAGFAFVGKDVLINRT